MAEEARSQGIGKALLDFLKAKKPELHLNVYQKNTRAIRLEGCPSGSSVQQALIETSKCSKILET